MADVARGHGGDTFGGPPSGGPPGGDGHWQPPNQCEASDSSSSDNDGRGKRGKSRNVGLRKILEANTGNRLEIRFEKGKHKTYKPIGDNAARFSSLVGTIVDRLPHNIMSWEDLPDEHKARIIPEIQTYFDMGTLDEKIRARIQNYRGQRFRDHKFRFKQKYFDGPGGEDRADIADMVPPDMEPNTWHDYVQHYTSPKVKSRSAINKANKKKAIIKGHGGRTSLAQTRHKFEQESAIDAYRRMYADANGNFYQPETATYYRRMLELQAEQNRLENPMSDSEIMDTVLGTRRGWQRGVGPIIRRSSSMADSPSQRGDQPMFTQADMEAFLASRMAQEREQWQAQMQATFQTQIKQATAPLYHAFKVGGSFQQASEEDEEKEESKEEEGGQD